MGSNGKHSIANFSDQERLEIEEDAALRCCEVAAGDITQLSKWLREHVEDSWALMDLCCDHGNRRQPLDVPRSYYASANGLCLLCDQHFTTIDPAPFIELLVLFREVEGFDLLVDEGELDDSLDPVTEPYEIHRMADRVAFTCARILRLACARLGEDLSNEEVESLTEEAESLTSTSHRRPAPPCPECEGKSRVKSSGPKGSRVRYFECKKCGHGFKSTG